MRVPRFQAVRGAAALLVLAAAAAVAVALPAGAQTMDELYTRAKAEAALTFYVGGPTAPWEETARQFSGRYPGIRISVSGGFSNVLDKKIDAQLRDHKLEVDAAIFQTLQDFVRWKEEARLLAYKPIGFEAIDPSFKDPEGAYYGIQVIAMPYMFNTQAVKGSHVPDSALDFLKPEFRGRLVTPYPADDDATLWLFHHVVQKYGWGYMDRYMANKPNFIQGHLDQQRSIAAGKNWVAIDSIFNITAPMKKTGAPVESHVPAVDATPIWPLTAAIFSNAPHPEAAKLFLSWLLEPAQQARTGTWSTRRDVAPPEGMRPIFSYKVVNDYRSFLTDQNKVAALRKRFEHYTGPVLNAGGVK